METVFEILVLVICLTWLEVYLYDKYETWKKNKNSHYKEKIN